MNDKKQDMYLIYYSWLLLGYILLGKSWAYIGLYPLYIGDIFLIFGLLLTILYRKRTLRQILTLPPSIFLLIFILWEFMCTLTGIPKYGIDALRDGVIWGYSFFSFIIASILIMKPICFQYLLDRYRKVIPYLLICIPLLWIIQIYYSSALPYLPNAPVKILNLKGGDIGVHLSGLLCFIMIGVMKINTIWLVLCWLDLFICVTHNRGGTSGFLIVFAIIVVLNFFKNKIWKIIIITTIILVIILFIWSAYNSNIKLAINNKITRITSTLINDEINDENEGTKRWRLMWWKKIVDYTFYGPYFWTGKGFGINLAVDDGFQGSTKSLRTPHSSHLTILARSGVPGFFLWILLQLNWGWNILKQYFQSKHKGYLKWSKIFLFLLCYWTSAIINSSFDVYIEGPQGGIWFWTIFGIGLAAIYIYKKFPEILQD